MRVADVFRRGIAAGGLIVVPSLGGPSAMAQSLPTHAATSVSAVASRLDGPPTPSGKPPGGLLERRVQDGRQRRSPYFDRWGIELSVGYETLKGLPGAVSTEGLFLSAGFYLSGSLAVIVETGTSGWAPGRLTTPGRAPRKFMDAPRSWPSKPAACPEIDAAFGTYLGGVQYRRRFRGSTAFVQGLAGHASYSGTAVSERDWQERRANELLRRVRFRSCPGCRRRSRRASQRPHRDPRHSGLPASRRPVAGRDGDGVHGTRRRCSSRHGARRRRFRPRYLRTSKEVRSREVPAERSFSRWLWGDAVWSAMIGLGASTEGGYPALARAGALMLGITVGVDLATGAARTFPTVVRTTLAQASAVGGSGRAGLRTRHADCRRRHGHPAWARPGPRRSPDGGLACALAAGMLGWSGRFLGAMSLDFMAQSFPGSQVGLAPLARLLGEQEPGVVTRVAISVFEGLMFGSGRAAGLTNRPR